MLLLIAYALMLVDATMTLVVYEDAPELNPLYAKLLAYDSVKFIYLKVAISAALAIGLLILHNRRPNVGRAVTVFAVVVYGAVSYIHVEILRAIESRPPLVRPLVEKLDEVLSPTANFREDAL